MYFVGEVRFGRICSNGICCTGVLFSVSYIALASRVKINEKHLIALIALKVVSILLASDFVESSLLQRTAA